MGRNTVLITIDCLRADHLSCYGYRRKTTPFIDHLASKGLKFENAFANGPFTAASFLSIFASAYPLDFKHQLPLPKEATLISQVLQGEGIKTAAIHSNPYLSAFYGYNRGWDYFEDFLNLKNGSKGRKRKWLGKILRGRLRDLYLYTKLFFTGVKAYEEAETITNCAIDWLNRNMDSSFFLWIHYMDLHEPYFMFNTDIERVYSKNMHRISEVRSYINSMKRNITSEDIKNMIDVYDDKLRYIDRQLKSLVNFLENSGLLGGTLMIIVSDHGQEFLDHGVFGHFARFYEEIIHIPLILFGSNITSQVNENLVSQIDIPPTILSFHGSPIPWRYRGRSLLTKNNREYIVSEAAHNERGTYIMSNKIFPSKFRTYAIRTKKWKYICKLGGKNREIELYNLLKDPKEKNNISNTHREVVNVFSKVLSHHISKKYSDLR